MSPLSPWRQRAYLRSRTLQDKVKARIRAAQGRYNIAWAALSALHGPGEWEKTLAVLKPEDIWGISERSLTQEELEDYCRTHLMAGLPEDANALVTQYAREQCLPRIYLSANSGACLGLAEETLGLFSCAWNDNNDPEKGFSYLYLTAHNHDWCLGEKTTHPIRNSVLLRSCSRTAFPTSPQAATLITSRPLYRSWMASKFVTPVTTMINGEGAPSSTSSPSCAALSVMTKDACRYLQRSGVKVLALALRYEAPAVEQVEGQG